ncbi:Uncharacterized protein APZ42_007382, partial [Daphnia magna]
LGLDLSPFVDLEKQGLDQPFYSHTYHWNSGMVAVVAGHFLVLLVRFQKAAFQEQESSLQAINTIYNV